MKTLTDNQREFEGMCSWHEPKNIGYLQFQDWCEKQEKKGLKQAECKECKFFFYPEEMGSPWNDYP